MLAAMAVSSVERHSRPGLLSRLAEEVAILRRRNEAGARGEEVAEILRHALVDPQKLAMLHLVKVGLVERFGTAVLAVPGMGELVRKELAVVDSGAGFGVALLLDAVVGGLAVLKALATSDVRQRKEEVIDVVM